jgi:hypothetical protein
VPHAPMLFAMDVWRTLAEEIGPRPPCSEGERRAASWCARRLGGLGFKVDVEHFSARRDSHSWFAAYFCLSCAGALLIVPLPLVAALLGAVALVLYARDVEGRPVVRPRGGVSSNVVARPVDSTEPRAVVLAHIDSGRSSPRARPSRAAVVAVNAAMVAVPFIASVAWIAEVDRELPDGLWVPSVVLAVFLLVMVGLELHAATRAPFVDGANDNASGVEVLMRVAATRPSDVWFVLTGASEAGMLGIQAFLQAHDSEVGDALFINIDTVGCGDLKVALEEGVLWPRDAYGGLIAAAEANGAEAVPWLVTSTDATALLARRYKVASLLRTNDRGELPNSHRPTDVVSNVDEGALRETAAVVTRLLAHVHREERVI